jgi:hypothetical protein
MNVLILLQNQNEFSSDPENPDYWNTQHLQIICVVLLLPTGSYQVGKL